MNGEDGQLSAMALNTSEDLELSDPDLGVMESDDPYEAILDDLRKYTPHNMDCKKVSENLFREVLRTKPLGLWSYQQRVGAGADFTTSTTESEIKDWGPHTYLTPTRVRTHVLPRFLKSDPSHRRYWILFISCPPVSPRARSLLKAYGIQLVWIPVQITSLNSHSVQGEWASAVNILFTPTSSKDMEVALVQLPDSEDKVHSEVQVIETSQRALSPSRTDAEALDPDRSLHTNTQLPPNQLSHRDKTGRRWSHLS